jgi:hypothetical protein
LALGVHCLILKVVQAGSNQVRFYKLAVQTGLAEALQAELLGPAVEVEVCRVMALQ